MSPERPNNLRNLRKEARVCSAAGQWDKVINACTEILVRAPEDVESLNERGRAFRCVGNRRLALQDFGQAVEISKASGDLEGQLTATVGQIDAWRTADRDADFPYPANVVTPEEKRAYGYQHAIAYADEAQVLLSAMPAGFSEAKGHAYNNFGLLFNEVKDYARALQAYTDAETGIRDLLRTKPRNLSLKEKLARTIHLKGIALEYLGQLPEAEACQRESLEMSLRTGNVKNIGNPSVSLGDVLIKTGRVDEGYDYYGRAKAVSEKEDGTIADQEIHQLAVERLSRPR